MASGSRSSLTAMTTEPPEQPTGDEEPEPGTPERVRTGVHRVDEVIRAVEELEERPIEEHVGVFESAQVQLRRALDDHPTEARTESATRAESTLSRGPRKSDPGDPHEADDHPGHT